VFGFAGRFFILPCNIDSDNEKLDREMQIVADAYRKQGHLHDLKLRTEGSESDLITWLVNKLVK